MRSRLLLLSLVLLLDGCDRSGNEAAPNAEAAAGNAAVDGAAPAPAPSPPDMPSVGGPPIAEAPVIDASAEGAATVVRAYYALIEGHKYREAWGLWGDGGRASGTSVEAFADSFAKYADYDAEVGPPGKIEAGAGQRYVEVPVTVRGRLKQDNRPFSMAGTVTLHRTADIDGATAEQRSWRISATAVTPNGR